MHVCINFLNGELIMANITRLKLFIMKMTFRIDDILSQGIYKDTTYHL
jgi:hypothetical protein